MKISIYLEKENSNFFIRRIRSLNITKNDQWYEFAEDHQPSINHKEIMDLDSVKDRILAMRRNYATINLNLPEELYPKYLDKGNLNFLFNNQYLSEYEENSNTEDTGSMELINIESENLKLKIRELELKLQLTKTLQNAEKEFGVKNTRESEESDDRVKATATELNLDKISKRMQLVKYNTSRDATEFIDEFEKECLKFKVSKDDDKIILLKSFLSENILDWYYSTKTRSGNDFQLIKGKFLTVYGCRGWLSTKKAIEFKYVGGRFLDYAISKNKLLIEDDKDISEITLVKLIVSGLPHRVL